MLDALLRVDISRLSRTSLICARKMFGERHEYKVDAEREDEWLDSEDVIFFK